MANYPSFGQDISSTVTILDDINLDRASNGKPRMRRFYTSPVKEFSVVHTLTAANKDTLLAFYNANRYVSFTFVWNAENTTHTAMFSTAPTVAVEGSIDFWKTTCGIIEV